MNPLSIEPNGPEWEAQIRARAKQIEEDEDQVGPNLAEIKEMMESWRINRPKMWRRLHGAALARPLAIVLQNAYRRERDRLLAAGMPWTDAREQASTWLMWGPEDDETTEE